MAKHSYGDAVDAKTAAEMIGITPAQLRCLVKKGDGPAPARAGGRTVYFVKDVEDYVSELKGDVSNG